VFALLLIAGLVTAAAVGLPRLLHPAHKGGSPDVSMTVTRVRSSGGKTLADVTVTNRSNHALSLPVFRNCSLIEQESGRSHAADPFATEKTFNSSLPPATTTRGTLVFEGTLSAGTSRVTISFDVVFGTGKPLLVRDVAVR